jgi:hypothetical protein
MKLATFNDEQIYHYHLGRFVTLFSKAEHMVFFYLADLLGITKDECNAVTSGAKIDGCIEVYKTLSEVGSRLEASNRRRNRSHIDHSSLPLIEGD